VCYTLDDLSCPAWLNKFFLCAVNGCLVIYVCCTRGESLYFSLQLHGHLFYWKEMDLVPLKKKTSVHQMGVPKQPRVVVPKQVKVGDRDYEVFTQETPRGYSSQSQKNLEVVDSCSGIYLIIFIL
jgi:hypothetical protein